MQHTTNLNLNLPEYNEAADIQVINGNMNTIDTAITAANTNITATKSDLGIVEDGNTATHSITAGQYVIWKGNLYTAKSAIATGTTLSTSNLTAVSNGGLNSLNEQIVTLDSKFYYENQTANTNPQGLFKIVSKDKYYPVAGFPVSYGFSLTGSHRAGPNDYYFLTDAISQSVTILVVYMHI